jgi:hypothetical protein
VRQVRPVEVHWKLFSLEEINKGEDKTVDWEKGRTAPLLRVLALVRRKHGEDAIDRFYDALGRARFVREKEFSDPSVIEDALAEAGLDRGLRAAALADPSTREEVEREHKGVVDKLEAFGVPTLVLDNGEGPGVFGPVINPVPTGEDAGKLWDHTLWLTRQQGFFELKRTRGPQNAPRH